MIRLVSSIGAIIVIFAVLERMQIYRDSQISFGRKVNDPCAQYVKDHIDKINTLMSNNREAQIVDVTNGKLIKGNINDEEFECKLKIKQSDLTITTATITAYKNFRGDVIYIVDINKIIGNFIENLTGY